ncbi:hypothetical protein ACFV2D_34510 [Streptomyces capillispiralis]|uniref:hypothetical protein n=1 Tax=Streptomyces capillispiralis TaxID=68182 RepID=UPI0036B30CBA
MTPQQFDTPTAQGTWREPWFARHGPKGDAQVIEVARQEPAQAAIDARGVLTYDDPVLLRDVETAARRLLLREGADTWTSLLRHGELHALHGRLVWLSPVLDDIEALPAAGTATPESEYDVSFTSTSAATEKSRTTTRTAEAGLLAVMRLTSRAASAVVPAVPVLGAEVSEGQAEGDKRTVISGHTSQVEDRVTCLSGIRLRVFVDGVEHSTHKPIARGLRVSFSAEHAGPAEGPDRHIRGTPDGVGPAPHRRSRETLHAVDLVPLVAAVQRDLREAGLSAESAVEVVRQAQGLLNEQTARTRHGWWLSSGDTSGPLGHGTALPGFGGFRGHLRIRATIDSAQFLGVSGAKTRTDMGTGSTVSRGASGESEASVTVGVTAVGLHVPTADATASGTAPSAAVTLSSARGWSTRLAAQSMPHTVLTVQEPQARYGAMLLMEVEWQSPTHPALTVTRQRAWADLGVAWRQGSGAADFEQRVFGRLVSPYVRDYRDSVPPAAAVPGQPHTRARARPVPRDVRLRGMPRWTKGSYRPTRSPGEPPALASRVGLGTATVTGVAGAEWVRESVRAALDDAVAGMKRTRRDAVDWAGVDRQLDVWFGAPALAGGLPALMAGTAHTLHLGGVPVTVDIRAHLLDSLGVTSYGMRMNSRVIAGTAMTAQTDGNTSFKAGLGGGARVNLAGTIRFQLGALRLTGGVGWGSGSSIVKAGKFYARKETGSAVDQHTLDLGFRMELRRPGAKPDVWYLYRPHEMVAKISVPHEFSPSGSRTGSRTARLPEGPSHPVPSRDWPAPLAATLRLDGAASGIYAHFPVLPHLRETVAAFHRRRRPGPLPETFAGALRPDALAAAFPYLVSERGHTLDHTAEDGWTSTLRLRLRLSGPRPQKAGGPGEIEALVQSASGVVKSRTTSRSAQVQLSVGPRAAWGGTGAPADAGDDASSMTRLGLFAEGAAVYAKGTERRETHGAVDVARVTYEGTVLWYATDVAVEVTLGHSRGRDTVEDEPRYLFYSAAVDLLMPPARWEDIRPNAVATPPAPPDRAYVNGGVVPSTLHGVELLRADGVLETILEQARARGVVPAPSRTGLEHAHPLARTLEATFRKENLTAHMPALLGGTGLSVSLPFRGPLGATRFLSIRVRATGIEPARSSRHRPEAQLTLRSESVEASEREDKSTLTTVLGAHVSIHGGLLHASRDARSAGGIGAFAGHAARRGVAGSDTLRKTGIYRGSTKGADGCQEFEHEVGLSVDMAVGTTPPEVIDAPRRVLTAAGRRLRKGTRGGTPAEEWSDTSHHPVRVGVRLLVPRHLTVAVDAGAPGAVSRLAGAGDRRWWGRPVEPGPALNEALPEAFARALIPWDMPAARTVHRWLAFVAADVRPERPSLAAEPPDVRGLASASGPGPAYEARTSVSWLRPRVPALLRTEYEVPVDGRMLRVGLKITGARIIGPCDGARWKARRYEQTETHEEGTVHSAGGVHWGADPFAGTGTSDDTFTAKTAYEYSDMLDHTAQGGTAQVEEHNAEATRNFRYYRFDVTVVIQQTDGARRALHVPVPGGLVGMLPLDGRDLAFGLESVPRAPWLSVEYHLRKGHPDLGRLHRLVTDALMAPDAGRSGQVMESLSGVAQELRALASSESELHSDHARALARTLAARLPEDLSPAFRPHGAALPLAAAAVPAPAALARSAAASPYRGTGTGAGPRAAGAGPSGPVSGRTAARGRPS